MPLQVYSYGTIVMFITTTKKKKKNHYSLKRPIVAFLGLLVAFHERHYRPNLL